MIYLFFIDKGIILFFFYDFYILLNFENYNISRGFGAMGNGWNSEFNLKKDEKLNYRLSVFDLEQLINLFFENNISFIDLLFLTRNVRNG